MKLETELMRGAGPTAVMQLLSSGEKYGYELVEALAQQSNGVLAMGQSTLYPLLYNLEAKGLLTSRVDETGARPRRFYRLTQSGRRKLADDTKQWRAFMGGVVFAGHCRAASGRRSGRSAMTTVAAPSLWRRLSHTRLRDAVRGRFDSSLDWRLVISEAQLPLEISSLVEKVVRGTRLWRREKVTVATELVAHFQDGLEAGRSPSELVESFGDPKQTAQLIRRAKKRGRSLIWQAWRYGWWAIGALVLAYVLAGMWMLLDRPSVTTDYLAMINERALNLPANEKAWPLYRDAFLAMDAKRTDVGVDTPFVTAANSRPGDKAWATTQNYLKQHQEQLKQIRDAASRPGLGFAGRTLPAALDEEDRKLFGMTVTTADIEAAKQQTVKDRWLISTLLPHLEYLRSAALILVNDVRNAAANGDGASAKQDVVAIYGIARHCEEAPFLVNLLVAEVTQRQARIAIQDVLRDAPEIWSNDELRDIAHQTAAAQIDWRRGFVGERASFYDSIQRVYTDDGNGDGRLALYVGVDSSSDATIFQVLNSVATNVPDLGMVQPPLSSRFVGMLAMPATNMVVASRKDMTDQYDRLANRALEELETPLWEQDDAPTIDDEAQDMAKEPLGQFRYLFVNLMLPSFDSLKARFVSSQGEREGVLIGLALELYHREHKKWPESLAELSPRYLPELPVDRITGKPLLLKIIDDRPVVYSRGVDSDDDGGRLPKYYADGEYEYSVGPPYELDSNSTEYMRDQYDGDWVLWSTVKSEPKASVAGDE